MTRRLLSIDGGGVLGCGPSHYLARQEADVGLREDAIAGTSVGGLLALLRASGRSWQEIDPIFQSDVGRIFHSVPWYWHLDPTRPKWMCDGFEAIALELFGDQKMSDAVLPVFIPVSDFRSGGIKVYDRSDSDLMRDVAIRTASAPTYFAPRDARWADGGIIANNPSTVAVTALHDKEGWAFEETKVWSLATGGTIWTPPSIGCRMAQIQWASPVIHFAMQATLQMAAFQTSQIVGMHNHLRLDPGATEDIPLDALDAMPRWKALWDALFERRGNASKMFMVEE